MSIDRFLFKSYKIDNKHLRRVIIDIVVFVEGGEFFSKTLRKIFSKYHNIEIGMYSYGGCFSLKNVPPGTKIGRYCSFARNISIFNGNHPLQNKSLHPFFYNPRFELVDSDLLTRTKLKIGNDVWVGHNTCILPSVSNIGDGAVIGAGSIVTKDVPPFAVVVGNPAQIIKYRFSKEIIEKIIQSSWWDKDIEELKNNKPEFKTFLMPME